ncbi:alpha/beta fold hydrolase [Nitrospina watsonii]|uniref:Cis-3-alkyl-4-alkyloxetan-2-one decarboxylase n=1 Tax=Nitrospina watsonii TaxID=1323948 RepID=A0ABM9HED6_9BACT|nr:alpha/beta fold hydrolase [Nitrospina watsonii]CAI2718438.1 Cis-3-alkyl-4-alkyloxetan-2-one decarboxylase [Nitrospina watsonii]
MVTDVCLDELKNIYPFESHYLDLNELRYHYLDEGQGETLLMLHGNPTWSFYYRNLVRGLRSQYRCVVPDHMGCGLSDKPQDYNYTLSQHIDNLERLIEKLSLDNITLVMHDWGGAIGMGLAVRHPEKIKRLVLFNTAAFRTDRIPFSINLCRQPVIGPVAILNFNLFARMALVWACRQRDRMTAEVKRGYLAPYNSVENRIATLRFVQDIPMHPAVPSYPVVEHIESKLGFFRDRPVQLIWGMKDFCFNDYFLQRWKTYFPEAEIHQVEEGGHYIVEDAYEEIIPWMIQFFKRNAI